MSDFPPGSMPPPPVPPPEPSGPRPSVGVAISWAFDRFKANAAAFVGLAAVVTVIQFVQQIGAQPLENILTDCTNPQSPGQLNACTAAVGVSAIVAIVISLVFGLLAFIAQIGVQRAAIRSSLGVAPTFSDMFTTQYLGRYQLFTLCYAVLAFLGLILCIVPGFAVLFLFQLGPYYILDKGYGVREAMRASFNAVTKNFGPAILMTMFTFLVLLLGGVFFGILTLVTLPFACLFTAHMYRQFNREPVH